MTKRRKHSQPKPRPRGARAKKRASMLPVVAHVDWDARLDAPERGVVAGTRARHSATECACCGDLIRGHARWRLLWDGTVAFLAAQEPKVYARLLAKLERAELAGMFVRFHRGRDGRRTVSEALDMATGYDFEVPQETILDRARAFAADTARVSRTGRGRPRSPNVLMAIAYRGTFDALTDWPRRSQAEVSQSQNQGAPPALRCERILSDLVARHENADHEKTTELYALLSGRAWAVVADTFGYKDPDTAQRMAGRIRSEWRHINDPRLRDLWKVRAANILTAVPAAKDSSRD